MGPDSPCPPQCPAGWGKMPKWRPATTLDSPTAGRRRRRLRPSIGNGSPPSPFSLPPRPAVGLPPTLRPATASAPAPPQHRPEPGPRGRRGRAPHPPHTRPSLPCRPPPGPAGVGERPPEGQRWGRNDSRGVGTWGRGGPLGPSTAPEVKWPPAALERSRAARCGPSSSLSLPPP